jgi:hypothetical protein
MSSYTYFLCQSRCADAGDLNFIIYLFALFFFSFYYVEIGTQGLVHARNVFYH